MKKILFLALIAITTACHQPHVREIQRISRNSARVNCQLVNNLSKHYFLTNKEDLALLTQGDTVLIYLEDNTFFKMPIKYGSMDSSKIYKAIVL